MAIETQLGKRLARGINGDKGFWITKSFQKIYWDFGCKAMDFWRTEGQPNLISVTLYWGPECKATIVRRYHTSIVLPLVRQSALVRVAFFLNWKIHKEFPRRVSEGRKFSFRSRQPVATDFGYREENVNLYTATITWTSCFHPFCPLNFKHS